MTARPVPKRHWRSYGYEPLPTGAEALAEPFRAFPSWFMRVTCDRCGQQRMFSETHSAYGDMLIRDIIARMRHDGCGGSCCARSEGAGAGLYYLRSVTALPTRRNARAKASAMVGLDETVRSRPS